MQPRERVKAALAGALWDVVPTGELFLDDDATLDTLTPDCIGINLEEPPPASRLRDYRDRGMFLWGLLDGPFMRLTREVGWWHALQRAPDAGRLAGLARGSLDALEAAGQLGVDGIILCDDVAHSRGAFFSPSVFEKAFVPAWAAVVNPVKDAGLPVLLHTDGRVEPILRWVLRCGFDGVHSLDPEAGVDVRRIRIDYGDRLCLMGGLGLSTLVTGTREEILAAATDLVLAGGRRFIFGTSSGTLPPGVSPRRVAAAYRAAREASTRTVRFLCQGSKVQAAADASLLEVARQADAPVESACDGRGVCGRCLVRVVRGRVSAHRESSTAYRVSRGMVLACQARADTDLTIEVRPDVPYVPGMKADPVHQSTSPRFTFRPARVSPPDPGIQGSQCDRVLSGQLAPAGTEVVRSLAGATDGQVLEAVIRDQTVIRLSRPRDALGVAFDIGTTTLTANLLDMRTGRVLASRTSANPQRRYGVDVMTRLLYADREGGEDLRSALCASMEGMAREMAPDPDNILHAVAVGNTSMIHLLLNIPVSTLTQAPFTPVCSGPITLSCRELGLDFHPRARMSILPSIGGFVGADAVAAALATGVWEAPDWSMCVDLGTNGEILLGRQGLLLACSAPAGPAFEGVGLEYGMPAVTGAVRSCALAEGGPELTVIGGGEPLGMCGSGLVDLLAVLLETGHMRPDGRLLEAGNTPGLMVTNHGAERSVVLENEGRSPILLSQGDIRQLQLAKAAVRSGIDVVCTEAGISPGDVSRVHIAGSFGNSLQTESVSRIGLLPDDMCDRVSSSGNAALRGASIALLDAVKEQEGVGLARGARLVDLATYEGFQEKFLASMSLGFSDR